MGSSPGGCLRVPDMTWHLSHWFPKAGAHSCLSAWWGISIFPHHSSQILSSILYLTQKCVWTLLAESFLAVPSSVRAWPLPMAACILCLPRVLFSHLTNSLCALLGTGPERQILPSDGCTPTFKPLKPGLASRLLTMGYHEARSSCHLTPSLLLSVSQPWSNSPSLTFSQAWPDSAFQGLCELSLLLGVPLAATHVKLSPYSGSLLKSSASLFKPSPPS